MLYLSTGTAAVGYAGCVDLIYSCRHVRDGQRHAAISFKYTYKRRVYDNVSHIDIEIKHNFLSLYAIKKYTF